MVCNIVPNDHAHHFVPTGPLTPITRHAIFSIPTPGRTGQTQEPKMQFDPSTPRAEVTIQGAVFALPTPFAAGHSLTEGEASAMNQLLAENVRNNVAGKMKARAEKGEVQITQAEVDAYVAEYEFGIRKVGGGEARLTPVEREANRIARDRISAALKERNQKVEKEVMAELVAKLATREDILKEAEKRVKAVSKISIEELGLGEPTAQAA